MSLRVDLTAALDDRPMGRFQKSVVTLCFLVSLVDGRPKVWYPKPNCVFLGSGGNASNYFIIVLQNRAKMRGQRNARDDELYSAQLFRPGVKDSQRLEPLFCWKACQ